MYENNPYDIQNDAEYLCSTIVSYVWNIFS